MPPSQRKGAYHDESDSTRNAFGSAFKSERTISGPTVDPTRAYTSEGEEEKAAALRMVDACVEVFSVSPGYGKFNNWGPPQELSFNILTQLKFVCQNFQRGLDWKITKIEYVMNAALYSIFNETKNTFRAHGKSTKEILLFHGTTSQNIDK